MEHFVSTFVVVALEMERELYHTPQGISHYAQCNVSYACIHWSPFGN